MNKRNKQFNRKEYIKSVMIVLLILGLTKMTYCSVKDNSYELKDYSYFENAIEQNEIQQISFWDARNWMLITTNKGETYKISFPGSDQLEKMKLNSVSLKQNKLYVGEYILNVLIIIWGMITYPYYVYLDHKHKKLRKNVETIEKDWSRG